MPRQKKVETPAPAPDVMEAARKALAESVLALKTAVLKTGPMYGSVVRGVMVAMDAGVKRQSIAVTIANAWAGESKQPEDVSKGIGARYVILARLSYPQPIYGRNERPLTGPVMVSGHPYSNPLDALDSGRCTFTATYRAFTRAVQPIRERVVPPRDAFTSAAQVVGELTVPVVVGTGDDIKIERRSVGTDLDAFVGAMAALIASPMAQQVTTAKMRRDIIDRLGSVPGLSAETRAKLGEAVKLSRVA